MEPKKSIITRVSRELFHMCIIIHFVWARTNAILYIIFLAFVHPRSFILPALHGPKTALCSFPPYYYESYIVYIHVSAYVISLQHERMHFCSPLIKKCFFIFIFLISNTHATLHTPSYFTRTKIFFHVSRIISLIFYNVKLRYKFFNRILKYDFIL